jgi:hypothetical protein
MVKTWAPDDFWQVAQPLIPVPPPRRQGGGKKRADDRAVLAAIVYLVQAGLSWPKLPAALFGVSRSTVHRRFGEWTHSAKVSSPPSGWAATAGLSSPACPGCNTTAAWSAATTANPNTSKHSPTRLHPALLPQPTQEQPSGMSP